MKTFKSFLQLDELTGVAPKSKGEHKFVHSTYLAQIKDPGDLEKVGPEEIGPHDTKTASGKRPADRLDNKQKFGESTELEENYRTLAQKGIGAERKEDIKVGHGVDYYHPKTGDKHMGKIHSMSDKGYVVKDDKTGEKHSFDYFRKEEVEQEGSELDEAAKSKLMMGSKVSHPVHGKGTVVRHSLGGGTTGTVVKFADGSKKTVNHKQLRIEETELEEADFSKAQTTMAHTIGKHFKKKGIGDESKGGPYAVASAMVRDKPEAAKKAYATIKAKMKNEDHQDMLMALYDELSEENQQAFEAMLDSAPERLLSFAQSHFAGE